MKNTSTLLEAPHWTSELSALEAYLEEPLHRSGIPDIVPPEELANKYTDPRSRVKVIDYLIRKGSEQEDAIADITFSIEKIRIKIKKLTLRLPELSLLERNEDEPRKRKHLNIVPRSDWNASPAKDITVNDRLTHPIRNIYITFSTNIQRCDDLIGCSRSVKELQNRDLAKGLNDIAYNFIVGGDCVIYEGRGWDIKPEISSKNPQHRDGTIDVAFIGNYSHETYPYPMMDEVQDLIGYGVYHKMISETNNLMI